MPCLAGYTAIVEYRNFADSQRAISEINGSILAGRTIRVRKDQDTGERMYDVEPEDAKQRMKTPVRLRRPVYATRGHRTTPRVVSSSILSRFGPRGRLDAIFMGRGDGVGLTRHRRDSSEARDRFDGVPSHGPRAGLPRRPSNGLDHFCDTVVHLLLVPRFFW